MVRYYDLYQRLQLQFYILLMMCAMDIQNMYSDFAVNKYLHTVASCWILLIQSCDAWNHEYKMVSSYQQFTGVSASSVLVLIYQSTMHKISADSNLQLYYCENLKCCYVIFLVRILLLESLS